MLGTSCNYGGCLQLSDLTTSHASKPCFSFVVMVPQQVDLCLEAQQLTFLSLQCVCHCVSLLCQDLQLLLQPLQLQFRLQQCVWLKSAAFENTCLLYYGLSSLRKAS